MAEFRHSSSMGSRAVSSPRKRDDVASPLVPENLPDDDGGRDRHSRDRFPSFLSNFQSLSPYFGEDSRFHPYNSKISLLMLVVVLFVGLISIFSILNRMVQYYSSFSSHLYSQLTLRMRVSVYCILFFRITVFEIFIRFLRQ